MVAKKRENKAKKRPMLAPDASTLAKKRDEKYSQSQQQQVLRLLLIQVALLILVATSISSRSSSHLSVATHSGMIENGLDVSINSDVCCHSLLSHV